MLKKHILIAEDESSLVYALKTKFLREGFEVSVAKDGEEAIRSIQTHKPDLMLLDLIMPNIDGFGVLEFLKKEGLEIPVIVASNLSTEEDALRAKSLGAKDYIIKSDTSLSEIVEKIRAYL